MRVFHPGGLMRRPAALVFCLAISVLLSGIRSGARLQAEPAPRAASAAPADTRTRADATPAVQLWDVPDGGIQPQAVTGRDGQIHLLYFKGAPAGGDLYYVHRGVGDAGFSTPIRVNSEAGSVMATGSVRGGQIALGAHGRIHAAWSGSKDLETASGKQHPIWTARLASDGTRFDAQVNVATSSKGIDGATVAADQSGNVYVAWHAQGREDGEAHRTVYVARSKDAGARFAAEQPVAQASTGACGCCGLRALVDASGRPHILYRAATDGVYRNAAWLTLGRASTAPVVLQPWKLEACPMSTFALAQAGPALAAAWETEQQIYYSRLDPAAGTFSSPVAMTGAAGRKHPSVATNAAGATLVAWTEGTGWARGGTFAWAVLDREGRQVAAQSNAGAVPVWGLVAAAARPDGSFVILH